MKLEISIKASNSVHHELLLARLACIFTEYSITEKSNSRKPDSGACSFTINTEDPDGILQQVTLVISQFENRYELADPFEVHVRDLDCSEPDLYRCSHNRPFGPVGNIRIVPWHDKTNLPAASGEIFLTPSAAFGTGLHPTTRLCLQLLQLAAISGPETNFPSATVLDIGCGSGILTIAALRLGAAQALGVEIEQDAVRTARRNMQLNRLAERAEIKQSSWQEITGTYDLILANLVPSVLFRAAPFIPKLLNSRGMLVIAGFPAAKNKKVAKLFAESGLHPLQESSADGWGAMVLTGQQSV